MKYYKNNWNHENLKVKKSFILFVLFVDVVALLCPDLN